MKLDDYNLKRNNLREQWRAVRENRLSLKTIIAGNEFTDTAMKCKVRNNPEYKKMKKEQKHISKMIKHIENKIFKETKRTVERENKNDA